MNAIPDRLELQLYEHRKTEAAVLLSPDGNPTRAIWIPLSVVTMPTCIDAPTKPHGEAVRRGMYAIEPWMVLKACWTAVPDDTQGELL